MRLIPMLLFTMIAAPVVAQVAPSRFEGGPWSGLPYDSRNLPIGYSEPDASPVPEVERALVDRVVKALTEGDKATLVKLTQAGAEPFCLNEHGQPCDADEGLAKIDFTDHCRLNTPYYQADYDGLIRLEWICDDRLAYLTWLKIADDKISLPLQSANPAPVVIVPKALSADHR